MQEATVRLDLHGMNCYQARRVYGHHPKVLRLEVGLNPGATELVLREY